MATVIVWMEEVDSIFGPEVIGGPFFMKRKVINYITQTAIFGGLAAILYCVPGLQFKIPFVAPGFMEIHLDEIPILISSFAYGPLLGIFEILLRTLIKLPITSTMCVGELGDMMYSFALIIPASYIYTKNRTFKGAIIGLSIGLIANLFFTSIVNLYTIFPLYKIILSMPDGAIAGAFDAIYKMGIVADNDIRIALLLLPFNLIRNGIVIAPTMVCYKTLRFLLERIGSKFDKNKEKIDQDKNQE